MGRDMRRVWFNEEDCERLTRQEMNATKGVLGAMSFVADASRDLQKRLECIPYGKQRMAMAVGAFKAIADDIVGTIPVGQCRQIQNTMNDMDIRIVPKFTPNRQNVLIPAEDAKELIEAAQERCRMCVNTGEEARRCNLYKILESIVPLDDYGDGITCPYYQSEFE